MAEQLTLNQLVLGSSPSRGTNLKVAHQITFMNKRNEPRSTKSLIAVSVMALCSVALPSAVAEVVYDGMSSVSPDKGFNGYIQSKGPFEFGDDLTLAGTARLVNHFVFQYFGDIADNVVTMATLRFYANDVDIPGKLTKAPGSLLWQSDPFLIEKGDHIIDIGVPNIQVGETFTFSIEVPTLSGVGGNQFLLHTSTKPSDVGKSFNDFWVKADTVWSLQRLDGGAQLADFAVRVSAVPEPSSVALGALGIFTFGCYFARRNSRKQ